MAARTDPASPRRLQRARDSGDYPRSESLKRGLIWVAVLWSIPSAVGSLWDYAKGELKRVIGISHPESLDLLDTTRVALHHVFALSTPALVLIMAASLAAHTAESRGLPRFRVQRERFNHASFRPPTLTQFVPWLSLAVLVAYGWQWWRHHAVHIAAVLGRPTQGRDLAAASALHLAWIACSAWLILGGLELVLSRQAWLRRLGMTRGDKRREQRESEGDPWLASVLRERHRESLNGSALTLLSQTTIVIHAGHDTAVLLRYLEGTDRAPRILAIEAGPIASTLIGQASIAGVPTSEDADLSRTLARCRQGSEIPERTYASVALLIGRVARALHR